MLLPMISVVQPAYHSLPNLGLKVGRLEGFEYVRTVVGDTREASCRLAGDG